MARWAGLALLVAAGSACTVLAPVAILTIVVVVLDDLSSALDVETELRPWHKFADAGLTVLAVSHRAVAFESATRVLRIQDGTIV